MFVKKEMSILTWKFNGVNFNTANTNIINVFLNNKINSQYQSFSFRPWDKKEQEFWVWMLFFNLIKTANGNPTPQMKKMGRATPRAQPRWFLVQHSTLGLFVIKYFGFSESDTFWHLNISKQFIMMLGWTTKEIIRNRFTPSFCKIYFLNFRKDA